MALFRRARALSASASEVGLAKECRPPRRGHHFGDPAPDRIPERQDLHQGDWNRTVYACDIHPDQAQGAFVRSTSSADVINFGLAIMLLCRVISHTTLIRKTGVPANFPPTKTSPRPTAILSECRGALKGQISA